MRETELVERIKQLSSNTAKLRRLVLGIGDDCAVLRPAPGHDLVFTTDFTIEGRHFTTETHSPEDVGHKALARSLSDLAAMGASPEFCLISLAVTGTAGSRWTTRFYKGLTALAAQFGIAVAGGDLARADQITVDVMCCGRVPAGKALLRSGAIPGDRIYVTGELGASALGLRTGRGHAWRRHKRPTPRVEVGLAIRHFATSAMDLSDGLSLDLARLCTESQAGAELSGNLPITRGASLEDALHGGEDYELLFTASHRKRVAPEIAGVRITQIGTVTPNRGCVLWHGLPLEELGFQHF